MSKVLKAARECPHFVKFIVNKKRNADMICSIFGKCNHKGCWQCGKRPKKERKKQVKK